MQRSCIVTATDSSRDWGPEPSPTSAPRTWSRFSRSPRSWCCWAPARRSASPRCRPRGTRRARHRARGHAARGRMPHLQRTGPGGAAGRRGAVPALARSAGGRMIGRRHKGRINQPNNHSKLTDSNNCTVLFLVTDFLLLFRLPPPCVFCRSPSFSYLSSLGDRGRMLNMSQKSAASSLTYNEFFQCAGVEGERRACERSLFCRVFVRKLFSS